MTTELAQIVQDRNEWEARNFPTSGLRHAVLGVIEEIGELAHSHLKADQEIRGSEEEHAIAARDAIGDALIYLIGVARHAGVSFINAVQSHSEPHCIDATASLFRAANRVGRLASDMSNFPQLTVRHIGEIYWALADYCTHRDWDILEILRETWDSVARRDWTRHRLDGLST